MKYKPGQSGNPHGKPKGTLNNKTRWLQLLESHADELVEKAIELAESGDTNILRFCLERIIPKAKDMPISLSLPEELNKSGALFKVGSNVLRDMADQKITPAEAKSLLEVLGAYRDTGLLDNLMEEINEIKALVNQYEKNY
jgi:exonuclease III